VRQFSVAHLVALALLIVGAVSAVLLPRRHRGPWIQRVRLILAATIIAGWAGEYIADVVEGIWTVQYSLPLQLTDAVSLTAILALLTGRQLFIELLYFWSFSASLQAVLTPDLGNTFPNAFYFTYFAYHIGSIVAACLLVFGCRRFPRRGSVWTVYGLTLAWAALVGLADVITGGNYMYLARKPAHGSLLNLMGPWPAYIASGAVLALALFMVLAWVARAVQQRDAVPQNERTCAFDRQIR
jgi:hypothetical integral membrane protein (TIGR02206 family)